MPDLAAQNQLAQLLKETAQSKGIELPNIPSSPGRNAYLRFLASMGYKEAEVLPVIDREKVTGEMYEALLVGIMQAMQSEDTAFVKAVIWMAHNTLVGGDNSNLIVHGLATALSQDFTKASIPIPSFYAAVFPTDSYNAQCKVFDGERLVLLDTGCMEMAEAIVVAFLSKAQTSEKAAQISHTVDQYVLHGERADAAAMNSQGVNFGSGVVPALVNALEEFIVAHEIGHLVLGHANNQQTRHLTAAKGPSLEVVEKSELQEFQADMWACRSLIQSARLRQRSDSDLPLAVGGIEMGLGIALLVEVSAQKHLVKLASGHPPAMERLYMLELAFELFGAHEHAYIARRFHELLESVIQLYPGAEMPPMLDRNLNNKVIPVLESLGIDYSKADYIKNFV